LPPGTYRFAYFVIRDGRGLRDVPGLGLTGVNPDADASTVQVPGHLLRPRGDLAGGVLGGRMPATEARRDR